MFLNTRILSSLLTGIYSHVQEHPKCIKLFDDFKQSNKLIEFLSFVDHRQKIFVLAQIHKFVDVDKIYRF